MKKRPARITTHVLLSHMQNMHQVLLREIRGVETKLQQEIRSVSLHVSKLETKVDHNHRMLTMQIDGIDKRLDDIEIEYLPRRVRALEIAMRRRS